MSIYGVFDNDSDFDATVTHKTYNYIQKESKEMLDILFY